MYFPIPKLNDIFKNNELYLSVWGDFGVGKTTLALQISILSIYHNHKVLYCYTKPNFPINKLFNIAKEKSNDYKNTLNSQLKTLEIKNFSQLYSIILNLEFLFLKKENNDFSFNLIVFDSLTDLYKLELTPDDIEQNVLLNFQLNQILATLMHLKQKYGVNILIINETSRKTEMGELNEIQSGGKVMDYWINDSIKIERTKILNHRKLIIEHSNTKRKFEVSTKLTDQGFY